VRRAPRLPAGGAYDARARGPGVAAHPRILLQQHMCVHVPAAPTLKAAAGAASTHHIDGPRIMPVFLGGVWVTSLRPRQRVLACFCVPGGTAKD
jgi:hypothetical protein